MTFWVSTRMPSGTRQDSTQTVYVWVRAVPGAIGVGSGWLDSIVFQSMPSAPMMCVANVTVPEVAAVPPVLWKVTVTRSHQRLSASASSGAERVSLAGVAGGAGVVGGGGVVVPGGGAVAVRGGAVGVGGAAGARVVPGGVPVGVVPALVLAPGPEPVLEGAPGDGLRVLDVLSLSDGLGLLLAAPSSGTSVTEPVGVTAPLGDEPAPTAA